MVSRRSESTLYMQSNMMADSKQDLLQMDISPMNLLNPSILEWSPWGASEWLFSCPGTMIWKSGEQMLEMHILMPTLMKSYASLLDQNSKNYRATF